MNIGKSVFNNKDYMSVVGIDKSRLPPKQASIPSRSKFGSKRAKTSRSPSLAGREWSNWGCSSPLLLIDGASLASAVRNTLPIQHQLQPKLYLNCIP